MWNLLPDNEILQADIVMVDKYDFTYIHRKTTPIQKPDDDIIFTTDIDPRPNYINYITRPRSRLTEKIAEYYIKNKIFYQDNEIGEIVRNYLIWCKNKDGD